MATATGLALAASFNEELVSFFSYISKEIVGVFAFVIAAMAVLGFEGYMITMGIMKGISAENETERQKILRNREVAAIIILVISVAAGVFQRSFIIESDLLKAVLGVALMVLAGIGAPIALWLAAPVLGQTLNFQSSSDRDWRSGARVRKDS